MQSYKFRHLHSKTKLIHQHQHNASSHGFRNTLMVTQKARKLAAILRAIRERVIMFSLWTSDLYYNDMNYV